MTTLAPVEEFVLAPATCQARTLRKGQTLRITDLEGQQVADMIAFTLPDLDDRLWPSTTIRKDPSKNTRTFVAWRVGHA